MKYSTGKTTFIKYLLESDFPGMRIGPEPTTDCFIIISQVIMNIIIFDERFFKLKMHKD